MLIRERIVYNAIFVSIIAVIIAAIVVGGLSYRRAKNAIYQQVEDKLLVLRNIKTDQITNYLETISKQNVSFSNNLTVVQALKDFSTTFPNYLIEYEAKANNIEFKKDVINLYLRSYAQNYAKLNGGLVFNVSKFLNYIDETSFALQYNYILKNPNPINEKDKLDFSNDGTSYSQKHKQHHESLRKFKERFGLKDIILVDIDGNVVYTVNKEIDFTTSLVTGPYAFDAVGLVYKKAVNFSSTEDFLISDFAPHLPAYDMPASFIASPVFDGEKKIGVLIFQLDVSKINQIMTSNQDWDKIGLGNTGESYLIAKDNTMRSMSRFFLENSDDYFKQLKKAGYSSDQLAVMRAQNTSIGIQAINTKASSQLAENKSGSGSYVDYRKQKVIGSYAPFRFNTLQWSVICEIDESEALASIKQLSFKIKIYTLITIFGVSFIASIFAVGLSQQITSRISSLSKIIDKLAKTQDLSQRIQIKTEDELKEMGDAINSLLNSLQNALKETVAIDRKSRKDRATNTSAKTPDSIDELSQRLDSLAEQFKFLEEEEDKKRDW